MTNFKNTLLTSLLLTFFTIQLSANNHLLLTDTLLQNVYINEVMPSNGIIVDDYGETDDWLEIHNGSEDTLCLGGLFMTDDIADLQKWQIGGTSYVLPDSFALIWADGTPAQGDLHANFKLTSSGEFLALVQDVNGILHILDSLHFPEVPQNISYGRFEDGQSEWFFFESSTPAASNNGQAQVYTEAVVFSETGGHYDAGVLLEMSVTDPDATIHYTLNGSIPTDQDTEYQGPLMIDDTKLVQASAFKPGITSINKTTGFFIINESSEIAILNVQSNPDNFWDDETGIYVSGTNGGLDYCNNELHNWNQDWERPCQLTFLEPDGTLGFEVNAGMKIGGACSKNLKMKSFNFFLRNNDYGDERIEYQVFPNQELTEYRRLKIRNSGTDWIQMLFRDGMNQTILDGTVDIDLMAYRPVRIYLNGEYWGIYGLREMFNKYYVESHHGVHHDSVDILGDPYGPRSVIREGDSERYDEMVAFLDNNDLSISTNYETIQEFIDLQEYMNYYITQIYLANYDWPGNNVRVWRDKNNGKFRWMLFDTDASSGWTGWSSSVANHYHNTLAHTLNTGPVNMSVPGFTEWPNGAESTYMFRKMIASDKFKNEFIQRTCTFRELIFAADRVHPMVDDMEDLLAPEMERHISQWLGNNDLGSGQPSGGSLFLWEVYVTNFRNFFTNRASSILNIYNSTLNLNGTYNLNFGYDASTLGDIVIHENEMEIPFSYQGKYFKNIPIKIKAIPHPGYYFSHWLETGSTNAEIDFISGEDAILTPIFSDQPVSTDDVKVKLNVIIYPNPTQDILHVMLPVFESNIVLTVYDILGNQLIEKNITQKKSQLDMERFPSGMYLLKIETENGEMTKRVIVH